MEVDVIVFVIGDVAVIFKLKLIVGELDDVLLVSVVRVALGLRVDEPLVNGLDVVVLLPCCEAESVGVADSVFEPAVERDPVVEDVADFVEEIDDVSVRLMTEVNDCLLVLVVDGLPVDVLEALIETDVEGEAVFVLDFCGEYVDVGLELVVFDTEIEADVVFDDVVVFVDEIELVPVRVVTLDCVIKGLELLVLESPVVRVPVFVDVDVRVVKPDAVLNCVI
jgi:hypothetical protein